MIKNIKRKIGFIAVFILSFFLISCDKDEQDLKIIQEQTVRNYTISVLNSSNSISNGYHSLYIEIRNISNNELVDAGNINVSSQMQMSGMPMNAKMSATKTNTIGRYHIKYNFPMSGTWILIVNFDDGKIAQFSLAVN